MLDLAFVRNNLPLLEEKLRQRGLSPSAVADFDLVDQERRHFITKAESLKAEQRSEERRVGKECRL